MHDESARRTAQPTLAAGPPRLPTDRYDVLVVGAGLAGLECARRIAAGGAKVALVDRKPSVDHAVHTTGIFVRRTLESFALPSDCLGPPVRNVALYAPSGRGVTLRSAHDEFRVGRMADLYRRGLDACLERDVVWLPSTAFTSASVAPSGVNVTLETDGRAFDVHARFVIGADGAVSRVAPALNLDSNREWIVGVEEVYRRTSSPDDATLHCWLDPDLAPGYIAWVVDDGEELHVGVGGYAKRFAPAAALRQFRERIADRFHLHDAEALERRGGRIPVGGVLQRIACAHGLLAGDAAGAVSPLTAGGLDPCLRLSALAADVTLRYLDTGDEAALLPYSGTAFRRRFRSRIFMRHAISRLQSRAAAEVACAALRLPGFRFVAERVFFGDGSFPDAPAVSDEAAALRGPSSRRRFRLSPRTAGSGRQYGRWPTRAP